MYRKMYRGSCCSPRLQEFYKFVIDLGVTPKISITMNYGEYNPFRRENQRRNTMKDITAGIIHIIAEYLGKDDSELTAEDKFLDIGLDSLDIMELVMQMQEEFDCKIELTQEITTIGKLSELIASQQQ